MNKTKFMLFVVCLVMVSCQTEKKMLTENDNQQIKEEVKTAFDKLIDDAKMLDVDQYLTNFDSTCFVGLQDDGKVLHNLAEFEEMYKSIMPMMKEYKSLIFENVKIEVLDKNIAVLVNEFSSEVELASGECIAVSGGGTQVWRKNNKRWKLVSVSSSSQ